MPTLRITSYESQGIENKAEGTTPWGQLRLLTCLQRQSRSLGSLWKDWVTWKQSPGTGNPLQAPTALVSLKKNVGALNSI